MKRIKKGVLRIMAKVMDEPVNAPEWPPQSPIIFYQPKRAKKRK